MGQWLKAIGGYSVEQIGEESFYSLTYYLLTEGQYEYRLLPERGDGVWNRVDAGLRDVDGLHARSVACTGVHVHRVYSVSDMYPGMGEPYRAEVLCVL